MALSSILSLEALSASRRARSPLPQAFSSRALRSAACRIYQTAGTESRGKVENLRYKPQQQAVEVSYLSLQVHLVFHFRPTYHQPSFASPLLPTLSFSPDGAVSRAIRFHLVCVLWSGNLRRRSPSAVELHIPLQGSREIYRTSHHVGRGHCV